MGTSEPVDSENPPDNGGGEHQPQLRAADDGTPVGTYHGLSPGVIA
jgi:hypothetical protein